MSKDSVIEIISQDKWSYVVGVVLALILFLLIALGVYYQVFRAAEQELFQSLHSQVEKSSERIEAEINLGRDQARFVHGLPPISGIVRATQNNGYDPLDKTELNQWKARLKKIFVEFINSHANVRMIRYIGVADDGLELVRVDSKDGVADVVMDSQLQSKSNRGYFKAALNLAPEQTYVSNIELNREHGEIEKPEWATYRVIVDVFDQQGQLFGMVVINFEAKNILSIVSGSGSYGQFYLLNNEGHYLVHPDPSRAFAFERGKAEGWLQEMDSRLPVSSDAGKSWLEASLKQAPFYYVSASVDIGNDTDSRKVFVVGGISKEEIAAKAKDQLMLVLIIIGVLVVGVLILILLYQRVIGMNYILQEKMLQYMAVVNGLSEAVAVVDRRMVVHIWNRRAQNLFGYTREKIENKSFLDLVSNEGDKEKVTEYVRSAFLGTNERPLEVSCISSGKTQFRITVTATRVVVDEQAMEQVVLFIRQSRS